MKLFISIVELTAGVLFLSLQVSDIQLGFGLVFIFMGAEGVANFFSRR